MEGVRTFISANSTYDSLIIRSITISIYTIVANTTRFLHLQIKLFRQSYVIIRILVADICLDCEFLYFKSSIYKNYLSIRSGVHSFSSFLLRGVTSTIYSTPVNLQNTSPIKFFMTILDCNVAQRFL